MTFVSLPVQAQSALGDWWNDRALDAKNLGVETLEVLRRRFRWDERILEVKNLEGIIHYAELGANINGYDPETGDSILRQVINGEVSTGPYIQRGVIQVGMLKNPYNAAILFMSLAIASQAIFLGLRIADAKQQSQKADSVKEFFRSLGIPVDATKVRSMRDVVLELYDHGLDPLAKRSDGSTILEATLRDYRISEEAKIDFIAAMLLVLSEKGIDFNTQLSDGRTLAELLLADYAPELVHEHPDWSVELIESVFPDQGQALQ